MWSNFVNLHQKYYWESDELKGALFFKPHLTNAKSVQLDKMQEVHFQSNFVLMHCQPLTSHWLNLFSIATCRQGCQYLEKSN